MKVTILLGVFLVLKMCARVVNAEQHMPQCAVSQFPLFLINMLLTRLDRLSGTKPSDAFDMRV